MKGFICALVLSVISFAGSAHTDHGQPGLIHLKFANGSVHAHLTWLTGPRSPSESVLRIDWKNGTDHSPIEAPGEFKVAIRMPDMEHLSSPTKLKAIVDSAGSPIVGAYEVSKIFFHMAGVWEVSLSLALPRELVEAQTFQVEIDGAHHH